MKRLILCLLLNQHEEATKVVKWNPDPMLDSDLPVCCRCGRVL